MFLLLLFLLLLLVVGFCFVWGSFGLGVLFVLFLGWLSGTEFLSVTLATLELSIFRPG